jgi:hypothetical protein
MLVHQLGTKFPNGGGIKRRLNELYEIFVDFKDKQLPKDPTEFISILTGVVFDSPSAFSLVCAFISKLIKRTTHKQKATLIEELIRKINLLPNSGLIQLWVQRITLPNNLNNPVDELLCKAAAGKNVKIFNYAWIGDSRIIKILNAIPFIDKEVIKKLDLVISKKEVQLFRNIYEY